MGSQQPWKSWNLMSDKLINTRKWKVKIRQDLGIRWRFFWICIEWKEPIKKQQVISTWLSKVREKNRK